MAISIEVGDARYVLRVIDPGLVRVSVIPGPFNDLVAAWQVAGLMRTQQTQAMFIAGEMCSTQ